MQEETVTEANHKQEKPIQQQSVLHKWNVADPEAVFQITVKAGCQQGILGVNRCESPYM